MQTSQPSATLTPDNGIGTPQRMPTSLSLQRSVGEELSAVKSSMRSVVLWKGSMEKQMKSTVTSVDAMEKQLNSTVTTVESMEKKLDLVLQLHAKLVEAARNMGPGLIGDSPSVRTHEIVP